MEQGDDMTTFNLEFKYLESFIMLYNYRNFTKAAERLYITQSALSRRIKNLEDKLGVELVKRNKHGVEITDAGYSFYKACIKLIKEKDNLYTSMNRFRRGDAGRLRIASDSTFGLKPLVKGISMLSQLYPNIDISYECIRDLDSRRYLMENGVDLVFTHLSEVEDFSEISYTELGINELIVAAGRNHRFFDRSTLTWEELDGESFAIPVVSHSSTHDKLFARAKENNCTLGRTVMVKDSMECIAYVATGKYLSFCGTVGLELFGSLPDYIHLIPVMEGENLIGWPVIAYLKESDNPLIEKFISIYTDSDGVEK